MEIETVLTIVASMMGGSGVTAITNYLNTKTKTIGEQKLLEAKASGEQKIIEAKLPVEQQSDLISSLIGRLEKVEKDAKDSQDEHVKCLQLHAETMEQLGMMKGQLIEQRENLNHMRVVSTDQAIAVVKANATIAASTVKEAATVVKDALDKAGLNNLPPVDSTHPLPVTLVDTPIN